MGVQLHNPLFLDMKTLTIVFFIVMFFIVMFLLLVYFHVIKPATPEEIKAFNEKKELDEKLYQERKQIYSECGSYCTEEGIKELREIKLLDEKILKRLENKT